MTSTYQILQRVADDMGASASMVAYLSAIKAQESGGRVDAKNPKSSATGLFQFISSTWDKYGQGGSIYDPVAQCKAAIRFTQDNARSLRPILGREADAGELYLAHFAGAGGASQVLRANPNASIREILGDRVIAANASIRFRGKRFAEFTARDIQDWADSVVRGKAYLEAYRNGDREAAESNGKSFLHSMGMTDEEIAKIPGGFLGQAIFGVIFFLLQSILPADEKDTSRTPTLEATNQPSGQPVRPTSVTFSKVTDTRAAAVSVRG